MEPSPDGPDPNPPALFDFSRYSFDELFNLAMDAHSRDDRSGLFEAAQAELDRRLAAGEVAGGNRRRGKVRMNNVARVVLDPGMDEVYNNRHVRTGIVDGVAIETVAGINPDGSERFSRAVPLSGDGVVHNDPSTGPDLSAQSPASGRGTAYDAPCVHADLQRH
ncbi:MAG: hypothetical protein QM662_08330 [Gordonia sp. (in: high G+C Gram-positive bacteria)]